MTTYEIIDVAQKQYRLKVLDYIYITLSDHIYDLNFQVKCNDDNEFLIVV